ncbi:MAG: PIN domain-containing protein [Gemmatimonadaceae bacterium]
MTRVAYVDTSCIVSIAFGERGAKAVRKRLGEFDELVSSNLLEAELMSAFAREGVTMDVDMLSSISWVIPDRTLTEEISSVLTAGYVRGADCWHLATALFLADDTAELSFVSLDKHQLKIAGALGFSL